MAEHTTLYRKWRPSDFDSVVGQDHITSVLRYEIASDRTTHAYLFCGSRGTGKTTCAKILAKAVNCLSPKDGNPCGECEACRLVDSGSATDIIEMDAASNNGVDYIRDIRDEVIYTPAALKKRVYIIDEVHMLSSGAFNALLKTLEEPPSHVVFILATTELHKLPATITSRCQRFDFRRISTGDIAKRLEHIAAKENIAITNEAAKLIGRLSSGGMRDAISLMELCSGSGRAITRELVHSVSGVTGRETVAEIVEAVLKKDLSRIFTRIAEFNASSLDFLVFWQELIEYYRDLLVIRSVKDPAPFLDLTAEELAVSREHAERFSKERLLYHIRQLEDTYVAMQRSASAKRVTAEMTLVRLTDDRLNDSNDALLSRISALEERLAQGIPAAVPTSAPPVPAKETPKEPIISDASPSAPTQRSELRSLSDWAQILETVERTDVSAAAQLRLARGYHDGKRVIVKVGDRFSQMLLDSDATKALLATAVNLSGELVGVTQNDISIQMEKTDPEKDDPFSSLS